MKLATSWCCWRDIGDFMMLLTLYWCHPKNVAEVSNITLAQTKCTLSKPDHHHTLLLLVFYFVEFGPLQIIYQKLIFRFFQISWNFINWIKNYKIIIPIFQNNHLFFDGISLNSPSAVHFDHALLENLNQPFYFDFIPF